MKNCKSKIRKTHIFRGFAATLLFSFALVLSYGYSTKAEEETYAEETTAADASESEPVEQSTDTILPNIYIGNTNVGGMTLESARNACAEFVNSINSSTIALSCKDNIINVALSDIGISTDANTAVETAYSYGRKGNVLKRYKETKNLENGGEIRLELSFSFDENAYANLENILNGFNCEPSSASIQMVDGSFEIQPETTGITVDTQASIEQLQTTLNNSSDYNAISMEIVYSEAEPEVTSDALNGITDKLGEYTTTYSGDAGRMANVENA